MKIARMVPALFLLFGLAACQRSPTIVGAYDLVALTRDGKPESIREYSSTLVFEPGGHFSMSDSENENQSGTYTVSGKTLRIEYIDSRTDQKITDESQYSLENGVLVLSKRGGLSSSTYNRRSGR